MIEISKMVCGAATIKTDDLTALTEFLMSRIEGSSQFVVTLVVHTPESGCSLYCLNREPSLEEDL